MLTCNEHIQVLANVYILSTDRSFQVSANVCMYIQMKIFKYSQMCVCICFQPMKLYKYSLIFVCISFPPIEIFNNPQMYVCALH